MSEFRPPDMVLSHTDAVEDAVPAVETAPPIDGLYSQTEIVEEVERLWGLVFESSSLIVKQAQKYGFVGIAKAPSPNIHDMLILLRLVRSMLDTMSDSADVADLGHDPRRQLVNSKQQIFHLEQIAYALQINDKALYETSVEDLKKQASF